MTIDLYVKSLKDMGVIILCRFLSLQACCELKHVLKVGLYLMDQVNVTNNCS